MSSFGSDVYGDFPFGGDSGAPPAFETLVGVAASSNFGSLGFELQKPLVGVAAVGSIGSIVFSGQAAAIGVSAVASIGHLVSNVGVSIKGVFARGKADEILDIKIVAMPGLAGFSGFMRRDGTHYAWGLTELLPQGLAWPREAESVQMKVIRGLAEVFGFVDSRAADLLEIEADPRTTDELLSDWERAWGLPDECLPVPTSKQERRDILVEKITRLGSQSRDFFWKFSRTVVKTQIYIQEFAPFTCGISQVGDTRPGPEGGWEEGHYRWEIGRPEIRFFWRVRPLGKTLHWFRCGRDNCGEDPMCRILPDVALECILRRLKPAQTEIVFDYSLSTEE